jgi:hypothetical protein
VPIDFEAFHDDWSDGSKIASFLHAAVEAVSPGGNSHYEFDSTFFSTTYNRTMYAPVLPVCMHVGSDPTAAYLMESEYPFRLAAYSQTAAATMGLRPGVKIASVLNLKVATTPTGAVSQSAAVGGNTRDLVASYGYFIDSSPAVNPPPPPPSATVSRLTLALPSPVPPAPEEAIIITGNPPSNLESLPGMLSQNCLDLRSSIHSVCVRSNLTNTSCLDTVSMNYTDVLCRIPINAQTGGIISFTGSHAFQPLTKISDIKTIRFQLTDGRGRTLWLNGLNWQISIMLSFVYQSKAIPPLSKEEKSFISHHEDRPRLKKLMDFAANKSPPTTIIRKRRILKNKTSAKQDGNVRKTGRKAVSSGGESPRREGRPEGAREAAGGEAGR